MLPLKSLFVLCILSLCGCQALPDTFAELGSIQSKGAAKDGSKTTANASENTVTSSHTDTRSTMIKGTGKFVNLGASVTETATSADGDHFTLNFVNAEIADVSRAVLGEMLGLAFTVDPKVRGLVTFQAKKPLARDAVVPALDKVFAIHDVVIVRDDDLYEVVPRTQVDQTNAPFQYGRNLNLATPGSRLQIVPLNYISVRSLRDILGRIGSDKAIVYDDPDKNFLILSGTQNEIQSLLDTIDIFDINSMEGMSYGFLNVTNTNAASLVQDIQAIFDRTDPSLAELVELIPIPRSNTILAISPQPDYITEVETWITKLDKRQGGPERRLHYYVLQNAKAEEVAETLNLILGIETAALPAPSPGVDYNPATPQPAFPIQRSSILEADGVRVVAETKNNALILFANATEYDTLVETIKQIDVAPDQVLIEAAIAEVTLVDELKYGIQWFFENAESTATLSDVATGAVTSKFPGFSYTYIVSNARAALNALSSVTDVNVLSSPKIMTLNNQTARLQVGDEVPVATQSSVSVTTPGAPIVNTVEFRDTGVILEVTPRINKSGLVIMDINQEVSDVAETTTSGIDSPTIQQRKVSSTVAVSNGETVALGGLIRNNKSLNKSGVPVLSKIPVLGVPFSSTDKTERRTELLIFITPRIIRSSSEAKEITDYLRSKLLSMELPVKTEGAPHSVSSSQN